MELDQILENLEESILIIKDYKGEFVNQRFLELFSLQVNELVPQESLISDQEIHQESKLQKLKKFLKV